MLVLDHIDATPLSVTASAVTIGNFDGIHLGHQALLSRTVAEARSRGIMSVVVTFDPHPLRLLAPARAPRLILALPDKISLLRELGVDILINQRFDDAFANLSAEDFTQGLLRNRLKAQKIFVGRDLRFGRGRKGTVEKLIAWGEQGGFEVSIVEPVLVDGVRVSSSQIRRLIEQGRVEEASALLGRYPFISGTVVAGHRRGRDLGFPTANIAYRTEVLPQDGIYATLLHIDDQSRQSVSSIGLNPTFGAGPRTVESHVLDFSGDLYGKFVRLDFVKRLREEKRFADISGLITQIEADVRAARAVFETRV